VALLVCTEYLLLKLMEAGRRMGEYVDGVQSTSSVLEVSSYCTYMEGVFVDSPPCVIVCMCLVLKLFCQFGAETFSWFKTQNNTDS